MMRILIMVVMVGTLSGCAVTDFLTPGKPQLEVNAAVGKNVKQEKMQVKLESQNQEAETISNDVAQTAQTISNVTNNIPIEFLILFALLAGWAIPDPKKCVEGLVRVWNGVVVAPIRGTGEWFLRLLGRS